MPTSALNRYRVRPFELTRIEPTLLFATPTVAEAPIELFAVAAVAALPPPPHAATDRATSGITAAPARKVMGLLRIMSLLRLGGLAPCNRARALIAPSRSRTSGRPRARKCPGSLRDSLAPRLRTVNHQRGAVLKAPAQPSAPRSEDHDCQAAAEGRGAPHVSARRDAARSRTGPVRPPAHDGGGFRAFQIPFAGATQPCAD